MNLPVAEHAAPRRRPADASSRARRAPWILGLIFAVLATGIVAAGDLYYRHYEQQYRAEVERQLSAIAELKTHELADWREERLGDAHIFFKNDAFSALVRRYFDSPGDVDAREQIRAWLNQVHAAYQYDRVFLLDAKYSKKMTVPEAPERETSYVSERTSAILRSGEIAFEDFYRNEQNERIYLEVLVPILEGASGSRLVAVVALRIDPATHLYPDISRWPTPSRTAETLIVRRDGNDALFLNNLRFQKDAALNLRVSLEEGKDLPAVKATMGQEGIVEGLDYRGVPVIAAVRAVPGSPWYLVARMDTSEAYAPARKHLWLMVVLVGVLVLSAGAGLGLVWRQQSVRFYREKSEAAEALAQSEKTFQVIFDGVRDGILIADARTLKFANANQAICRMLGYRRDEVLNLGVNDIHPQESLPHVREQFRRQTAGEISLAPDLPVLRKDGSVFPADVNATLMELGGLPRLVGVFRDVTERKAAEEDRRRLAAILEATPDFVGFADAKDAHILYINKAGRLMTGLAPDEDVTRLKISDVHPEWANRMFVETILPTAARDGVWTGECAFLHRDGHEIPVLMALLAHKAPSMNKAVPSREYSLA
jgi:PAS domain S-box-containing protein